MDLIIAATASVAAGNAPSAFVIREPSDLILTGGASVQAAPINSLRSGEPGSHTSAALRDALNPGATVVRVSMAYRYNTDYGPTGIGANFTLLVAGKAVYTSPHLSDFDYVTVDASSLAIAVPAAPQAAAPRVEFNFDNNDRNVQLLLPLTITVECSGVVPCTLPPLPPPSHTLLFEHSPRLAAGPEAPWVLATGPWWNKVHALSDTHALGLAGEHLMATTDGARTWSTPVFNDSDSCPLCDPMTSYAIYSSASRGDGCSGSDCGAFRTFGFQNETVGSAANISGRASIASTRYFLDSGGKLAREIAGPVRISGLPHLRMFDHSGGCITLADGSMIAIAKSTLSVAASPSGRLSAIAYRSTDGGSNWTFASVVAKAEEVPHASEGPSEGALATLSNGTLIAVMRVDGQSGHYLPYISKLSDDGGRSWHSLRYLRGGGSGSVPGAGCVCPRLLALNGSLVLAGGRPNPLSRDVVVWLNAAGDGEQWFSYSISYWHNELNTNPNWTFPEAATNNSRSFPRLTTSYTSLVRTGADTGYVLYGMGIRAFTMPFRLVPNPARR